MARLVLSDIRKMEIPGVGANRRFGKLSQKRITKAVRKALRQEYGSARVEVSCSAIFDRGFWIGKCRIGGTPYSYQLSAGLTYFPPDVSRSSSRRLD